LHLKFRYRKNLRKGLACITTTNSLFTIKLEIQIYAGYLQIEARGYSKEGQREYVFFIIIIIIIIINIISSWFSKIARLLLGQRKAQNAVFVNKV